MRERVRAADNVKLEVVTLDTDATVHTLYGQQMGGRQSYNLKNKGKKSYQPMLTFIAETREYIWANCTTATALPANKSAITNGMRARRCRPA